jgi:prepilin-type N-terminal cleavage/methylation domain-containing protein
MSKKRFLRGGFSLVELLVVVAIILVLTGIGSYTINFFIQGREISQVRDSLSDQIKMAKNLSNTNQLPDKSADLAYVKVIILNNKLTVEGVNNNGIGTTESPYFYTNLDDDVLLTVTNNSVVVNSFGFLGKTGRLTDGDGQASGGPVVIGVVNSSGSYSLMVNDLGVISNND